jgi:hypothetical protein
VDDLFFPSHKKYTKAWPLLTPASAYISGRRAPSQNDLLQQRLETSGEDIRRRIGSGHLIGQTERRLDMKGIVKIALVLCFAALGTAFQARADCRYVHGSITETVIPAPNDPFGRVLGNVLGVLNGANTAIVTSVTPSGSGGLDATSSDVYLTNQGDMLTGTGAVTLTPAPGGPAGEFVVYVTLTITGGSREYSGATGTLTLEGQAHNFGVPDAVATFDETYQGSVCGPNLNAGGNQHPD